MKLSLAVCVLAVLALARTHATSKKEHKRVRASSCSAVKPLFASQNISGAPDHSIDGSQVSRLCPYVDGSSNCCTSHMENQLKTLVKKELQEVLKQNSHSIQGVLAANSAEYLEKIMELSRRSENRTLESFRQVFHRLAPEAQAPIQQLYSELRRLLSNPGPTSYLNDSSADLEEATLHETVANFFQQLFPLVYGNSVLHTTANITPQYALCLQTSIERLRPFGDIPKTMGFVVARALRSVHDFLRALSLGTEALELAESSWDKTDECSSALLRMNYCPRCSGFVGVKPCVGYCLNVMRGCLAPLTELDASWNAYVDSLEEHVASSYAPNSLVKAEKVVGSLDTQISDAIMRAMEEGPALEKRVRIACGPVQLQEGTRSKKAHVPSIKSQLSLKKEDKYELETDLSNLARQVLVSLIKSKGFFSSLSESICADESFAAIGRDTDCWNGLRIAQYTRTVVGAGLGAQKYNPELPWNGKPTDSQIIHLSDRLRQVRRALLGQASAWPDSDNQMLDDGSGARPGSRGPADDEDNWNTDGSGSGYGDGVGQKGDRRKEPGRPHYDGSDGHKGKTTGSDRGSTGSPTLKTVSAAPHVQTGGALALFICVALHALAH